MSQHYELLYIVPAAAGSESDTTAKAQVDAVLSKVEAAVSVHEVWDTRTFAYPIGKHQQGSYVRAEFDAEPSAVRTIERELKLMPEVIRSLVVKKRVKTEEDLAEEKRIREKIQERKVREAHVAAAEAQQKEKEAEKQAAASEAAEPEKEKPSTAKPKIRLEELDEKLDDILSDDNI